MSDLHSDLLSILRNVSNPQFTFTAAGTETIDGVAAQVVDVNAAGASVKWYVDPSGRLLRTVARDSTTDFSQWKSFGGMNLPTVASVTRNGEKVSEVKLANAEVNVAVDPGAFVKK